MSGIWGALRFDSSREDSSTEISGSDFSHSNTSSFSFSDFSRHSSLAQSAKWPPEGGDVELFVSADLHLHNRSDVLRALGSESSPHAADSDALIILKAYRKWGIDCPRFLLGEFAFVICDYKLRRLFCCRDHMGFRPFFYWKSDASFVFASQIESLLHTPGVPRELNQRKLAGRRQFGGHHAFPEDTFHAGIMSLPSANWLLVEKNRIRRGCYWKPEIRPQLVPRADGEIYEALRELLMESVQCRVNYPDRITAALSGGLDSSAVVSLAAKVLLKENRSLVAIAAVLPEERRDGAVDEREFIDEFRSWPNVQIEYVTARNRGPFDSIEDPQKFEETPVRFSRYFLYEAFEQTASDQGASVFLEGSFGELGPSDFAERYYLQLAMGFRWLKLYQSLRKLRTRRIKPFRVLTREIRDFLSGQTRGLNELVLFTPEFLRQQEKGPQWKSYTLGQRRFQAERIQYFLNTHASRRDQTIPRNIRTSYPLADKRVLEFCLAVPARFKVRDGYERYLIRKALDGILPPRIQWRADKMPFSPDYFIRYNEQLPIAKEFVASIRQGDPIRAVIDVKRLEELLVPADTRTRDYNAREIVPGTIYAICFLRQFPEYRP
jgi:asparagine synthase (glutamine-hydrolysing)